MKKLMLGLIVILSILSESVFAQTIKISEQDKFNKQYRIQTSNERCQTGMSNGFSFYIRSIGNTIFLDMGSMGEMSGVIGEGSQLIFLLDNDSTVTVKSTSIQSEQLESNAFGGTSEMSTHEYYITETDIQNLIKHKIKSIRKYLSEGYVDKDFKDSWSTTVNKLDQVFIAEYNKHKN